MIILQYLCPVQQQSLAFRMGTGTVFDFVTPRYTATHTRSYTGISWVYIAASVSLFSCVFIVFFISIYSIFCFSDF